MTTNNRGFNTANFIRLARFGAAIWAWRPDQTSDGVLEQRLPSGRIVGYPGPPRRYVDETPTPETAGARVPRDLVFANADPSAEIAQKAFDDTWRAQEKVAALAADPRLAPQALADDVLAGAQALLASYVPRWAQLRGIRDRLDGEERRLFDPPPPDAVGVVLDVEIRDRVGDLDEAAYLAVLSRLGDDELAAVLLALRRDPLLPTLPDRDQQLIRTAWTAQVEARQAQAVEDYRAARETNEWAIARLKELVANAMNMSLSGAPALDRYRAYTILKPLDGLDLCDFEPSEVAAFESRAANDARRKAAGAAAAAARRPVVSAAA